MNLVMGIIVGIVLAVVVVGSAVYYFIKRVEKDWPHGE